MEKYIKHMDVYCRSVWIACKKKIKQENKMYKCVRYLAMYII